MSTRIISAIAGIIILLTALVLGRGYLLAGFLFVALLALFEFYKSFHQKGIHPVFFVGYVWTFILFLFTNPTISKKVASVIAVDLLFAIFIFASIVILFAISVFRHKRYNVMGVAVTALGILYIPYLLSHLLLTRGLPQGGYYIWIIFIGAWMTDTFAYFVGCHFGKNKILPEISPKKTWEGAIGGVLGCVLVMSFYGYYLINLGILHTELVHFVAMGIVCGVISQLGDWIASSIKRFTGVKDFGNIMPGHGGALDRFDSILVIAPFVYYYVILFVQGSA